jgi:hypothetical protein
MDAPLPEGLIERLAAHAGGGDAAVLDGVETADLPGGFVSASVRRIDLRLANGRTASYVLKACSAGEAGVMAAVGPLGAASFPQAIASGPGWFAAPFYEGHDLTFGDPAPAAVAADLARLHAAWEDRDPPPGLWTYDATHLVALHRNAAQALEQSPRFAVAPDAAGWRARLAVLGSGSPLMRLADRLARTLVHGDVHPGNIIARPAGGFVLIDWGNASHAPGMLDVANTIPIGSPSWDAYIGAYRAAGGRLAEAHLILAWRWASGVAGLMYLPWVAFNRDDPTVLIRQTLEADAALAEAADAPLP